MDHSPGLLQTNLLPSTTPEIRLSSPTDFVRNIASKFDHVGAVNSGQLGIEDDPMKDVVFKN